MDDYSKRRKHVKLDFSNLNVEPSPNPKTLKVQRVSVQVTSEDGKVFASGDGFIRNVNVHPSAHTGRG